MPAWIYSLAVNGGSAIATGLLGLIVLTALVTMPSICSYPKRLAG
nr:energy-coupled thiamine transporter ThiT [Lacticaseibacillus manihotivorans]